MGERVRQRQQFLYYLLRFKTFMNLSRERSLQKLPKVFGILENCKQAYLPFDNVFFPISKTSSLFCLLYGFYSTLSNSFGFLTPNPPISNFMKWIGICEDE